MTSRSQNDDQIRLANIFSDTNHDARFESMRKNTRSARVLRRHEDLRKQCEKEVRTYERWQKLAAAELRQSQSMYMDRLKKFKRTLAQPAFFSRSKVNVTILAPSPREVSSANSVPHYVRRRRSPRPTLADRHLPDIEDTHRSHSSVGTCSVEQTLSPEKVQSARDVSRHRDTFADDTRIHSARPEVPSLNLAFSGMEPVVERLPLSAASISDTPRIKGAKRDSPTRSGKVMILSATSTPRSPTSLPRLSDRGSHDYISKNLHKRTDDTASQIVEVRDLRPQNGRLLFSVRKENGEETYTSNKKKTVTFCE